MGIESAIPGSHDRTPDHCTTISPEGTLSVSYLSKAELFAQTLAAINCTLGDNRHIPLTPSPFDYLIPKIRILHYDVFHSLSGFDSLKTYCLDGVPPVVLRNCASELAPCLVKPFHLCLPTSAYSSCWKLLTFNSIKG